MKRASRLCGLVLLAIGIVAASLSAQTRRAPERLPPPDDKFTPRFEALAETKLLMEGLALPNYRSLEKHLQDKGPMDEETWAFARGQGLLIAETGNLLLLRPPRNTGRDTWMRRSMDLRSAASVLTRRLAAHDLESSRSALLELRTKCNACHQTFRVPTRIGSNVSDKLDK